MEIEKEYEKLKKKYSLPAFKELDTEFEISTLDSEKFLIRSIRRKVSEKLESFAKILEEVLQPEANMVSLIECKAFKEDEKKKIAELYRRIMILDRQSLEAAFTADDKDDAEFISGVLREWQPLKKQMLEIVRKIKDTWKEEISVDEELGYLG